MMKHDVKHGEYGQCKDDVFALWNTSVPVESVLEKNKEVKSMDEQHDALVSS